MYLGIDLEKYEQVNTQSVRERKVCRPLLRKLNVQAEKM